VPESKESSLFGIKIVNVDKVMISSTESEPSHQDDLKDILKKSLIYQGIQEDGLKKATLQDLLNKSITFFGFTI
jgi:hypothetical protein